MCFYPNTLWCCIPPPRVYDCAVLGIWDGDGVVLGLGSVELGGDGGGVGLDFAAVGVGVNDGDGVEVEAVGFGAFAVVFFVAEDGVADGGELYADLVFAAGEELDFDGGGVVGLADDGVAGEAEAAEGGVVDGVDVLVFVFGEVVFKGAGGFVEAAAEGGDVVFLGLGPGGLEFVADGFGLGVEHDAAGVAVEAVDEPGGKPRNA